MLGAHGDGDDGGCGGGTYRPPGHTLGPSRVSVLTVLVPPSVFFADPNRHGPHDERPGRRPATGQPPAPQLQHPQLGVSAADQAAQER